MADVSRLSTLSFNSFSASLLSSFASSLNSQQLGFAPNFSLDRKISSFSSSVHGVPRHPSTSRKQLLPFKVHAAITEMNQPKWWEKNAGPNMIDIHSTLEFLSALSEAKDRLVIVEFYGTWCASCRALFPKVLPYFHFYRGAHGQLESFSCSLAKFQKIKGAILRHRQPHCNIGPSKGVEDLNLESVSAPIDKPAVST